MPFENSALLAALRPPRVTAAVLLALLATVAPSSSSTAANQGEYLVGSRDVLEITVYEQPDLTGRFVVGSDGRLTFPLLGQVEAAGKTTAAIEAELRTRLADGFLNNPQLSVVVAEYRSQQVFVVGQVRLPGPVPLTGELSLVEALGRAGSVTDEAGSELIIVRRAPDAARSSGPVLPNQPGAGETVRVRMDEIRSGTLKQNHALQDGDTIFVPKAERIYVLGQVRSPGSYTYSSDLTVFEAIALAGGATDSGALGRVRIIRIVDGEKKEVKVKLTDPVEPGDTLMIPTRWF
jgi:polysaccharide export outer membrane protein